MRFRNIAMALWVCLSLTACADTQAVQPWPVECVGRVQISLPGKVDQAAYLAADFNKQFLPVASRRYATAFPDGQSASWLGVVYGGGMELSHPQTASDWKQYFELLDEYKSRVEADAREQKYGLLMLPTNNIQGYAWSDGNSILSADLVINEIAVRWAAQTLNFASFRTLDSVYRTLIAGLRPRPLFDTPHEPGVCLPYAFIRDDGTTQHNIAMSYRLKDHPDIVINLESRSAIPTPKKGDHARPDTVTDETRTSDFWNQQMTWLHTFKTHWKRPFSMRSVDIAGRKGTASFVEVVREKGGPTDHIYLVVARGNPDAPEAEPDLRLFVEQTQENATKRGMTPLTQDEVQALAEQITASVSLRPTH